MTAREFFIKEFVSDQNNFEPNFTETYAMFLMDAYGKYVESRYKPMESQVVELLSVSGYNNVMAVVEHFKKID